MDLSLIHISNPGLCKLLDETIGDGYKHDASDLTKLNKYADDKTVLKKLNEICLLYTSQIEQAHLQAAAHQKLHAEVVDLLGAGADGLGLDEVAKKALADADKMCIRDRPGSQRWNWDRSPDRCSLPDSLQNPSCWPA